MSPSSRPPRARSDSATKQTAKGTAAHQDSRSPGLPATKQRPDGQVVVSLPERLTFHAARDLLEALRIASGAALDIDGSSVKAGGTLVAQVLVAAARQRRRTPGGFTLRMSEVFRDDLEKLGVLHEFLESEAG